MFDRHLTDLSVSEFLQAVASAAQPVPAGGSVAALSGAACAALLVLVCDVFERHRPDVLTIAIGGQGRCTGSGRPTMVSIR